MVTKATKACLLALILSIVPAEMTSAHDAALAPTTPKHQKLRTPKPRLVKHLLNMHYFRRRLQIGAASWYGGIFQGRKTASGAIFDTNKPSCAALGQARFKLGARLLVKNLQNGLSAVCTVNDVGTYPTRIIDLSYAMKRALRMADTGRVAIYVRN